MLTLYRMVRCWLLSIDWRRPMFVVLSSSGLFISSLTPDNGKIDGSTTVSIYGRGFGLNELNEAFPKVNFIGDSTLLRRNRGICSVFSNSAPFVAGGSFDAEVTDRRSSRLLVVRAPRQAGISNKVTYDVKVETLGTEHGFTTGLQEADLLKVCAANPFLNRCYLIRLCLRFCCS